MKGFYAKKEDENNICNDHVYEAIFTEHYLKLRNYIYYKYGDLARAEDVVQDVFGKVWQNCATIHYNTIKSYLYKAANNSTLNDIRRLKVVRSYAGTPVHSIHFESPDFQLEEKEFMEKLQQSIGQLRPKQREAFLMHRIDKLSYSEIADLLDISVKAVEKRISQALIALKSHLGNYKF
ncbi:MAG: sigma-70 family RNA polymerase sigma factor [Leeuwenhoekiella sp.]